MLRSTLFLCRFYETIQPFYDPLYGKRTKHLYLFQELCKKRCWKNVPNIWLASLQLYPNRSRWLHNISFDFFFRSTERMLNSSTDHGTEAVVPFYNHFVQAKIILLHTVRMYVVHYTHHSVVQGSPGYTPAAAPPELSLLPRTPPCTAEVGCRYFAGTPVSGI